MNRTVTSTTETEHSNVVYGGYNLAFTVNRSNANITSIIVRGNKTIDSSTPNVTSMPSVELSFVPNFMPITEYNKDMILGVLSEISQIIQNSEPID